MPLAAVYILDPPPHPKSTPLQQPHRPWTYPLPTPLCFGILHLLCMWLPSIMPRAMPSSTTATSRVTTLL